MTKKNDRALSRENEKLRSELTNKSRQNSLTQLLVGIGNPDNITSFNTILQNNITMPLTILWTVLSYMYKTHGIIQTAIDMPVMDAFRGGLEIESEQLSEDNIADLQDALEEEGILTVVGQSIIWKRLFGGAALIINTDQDPKMPLDMRRINKLKFYAADRWELDAPYMNSEYYGYYEKMMHKSRVLVMSGKEAPRIVRWQLSGWGMSEVERMVEDFNRYLKTSNVLYELLEEAKVDVYKLEGLNDQLTSEGGTNSVLQRVQTVNKIKNFNHALLLDKNDEYDQKQLTYSGLAEVWKENRIGIASALRMPQAKIFGLSAQGFGSGEDDIENYNAMVESEVRTPAKPTLRFVIKLKCAQMFGIPDCDFSLRFKPLRMLSAVEEEQVKSSKQTRILGWQTAGNYTRQEAAEHAEKEGLITEETEASKGLLDEFGNPNEPEEEKKPGDDKKERKNASTAEEVVIDWVVAHVKQYKGHEAMVQAVMAQFKLSKAVADDYCMEAWNQLRDME